MTKIGTILINFFSFLDVTIFDQKFVSLNKIVLDKSGIREFLEEFFSAFIESVARHGSGKKHPIPSTRCLRGERIASMKFAELD